MAKLTPADALAHARSALASLEVQQGELSAKRRAALLNGDSATNIGKLDSELEKLKRGAQTESDRIVLLEAEVARQEKEDAAKRRAATIARVEKKLADADALADELEVSIAKSDALLRKIIKVRQDILPTLQLGNAHANAASLSADGCALAPGAVVHLLRAHIYKVGGHPYSTGTAGAPGEVSFPGGQPPRIEFMHQPERIAGFATSMRRGSNYAIRLLRGEDGVSIPLDTAAEAPPEAPPEAPLEQQQTPAPPSNPQSESRLSVLTRRLDELSRDASKESEYMQVVQQLAELTEGA